jgi:hypothetical protein
MNEFNEYQDSLNQYQDTSLRTEQDQQIEQSIQESAPQEGPQEGALHVTRNGDEVEVDYENTDNTTSPVAAPTSDAASLIESARDEDREYQQNMFQEASDWISEKLGMGTAEERQAEREEGMARTEEVQEQLDNTVGGEVVKTVTSGVEKAAQNAIGAVNFAGDFAKTKLGMVEEDDEWNNTDHKNYRGSERDLVFAEPRSTAGQMARDLVSFVVMTRQIGGITGLSKAAAGKGLAARVAAETGIGAVADFIADPSDPNAAAALQEFLPATKDNAILSAFATQDDDDEFTRRLKNTIEGGVMGVAVDAVGVGLKGLLKGGGKLADWVKANPGKKAADAPAEVKAEAMEQLTLALEEAPTRPGFKARMDEAKINSGTKSSPDYEPYERAGLTTETPMEKVLAEQAADPVSTRAPFTPGAPSPRLTDNTVRQISEAGGDIKEINRAVKELEDSLMPALRAKDPKVVEEAKMRLIKLHNDNSADKIDMSALTEVVGEGGDASAYVQQVLGNTVAKSYMRDLSVQISELSSQARQIADTGMDANRQYNLILDRLKATSKLQIRDASRRGVGLLSLKNKVLGINETAVAKKIEEFDTKIDTLRDRVNAGDVEAVEEMKVLTDALVLSDGDAEMSMSFMRKFFSMTKQNFETTMFNSYLSGLVTHERNILGNGTNVLLKPAQMAMGAIGKPEAKAALSMYSGMWGDLREGFRVARTALADNVPDRISKMEGFNNMNMAQKLENLRASAKTPQENAAAAFASAQYNLLANPWLQGATRLLDAADRGFRVLSARQKLRFDQNMLAIEDGIKFKPEVYDIVWGTKFKDGEIVDESLLNYAKQDTFQEDLGENMSKVADMINTIPFAKFVIPFVKTPTNIIKQTAHYVPLAGRAVTFTNSALGTQFFKEYDAVMRGSDEAAKAIYRGREGMGVMISVLGMGLGTQGLITGQGPQDPQKRKLWEEAGNQAHSINIGGTWVSTRFLGPMGILLSAYADLGMVASNAGTYDEFDEKPN